MDSHIFDLTTASCHWITCNHCEYVLDQAKIVPISNNTMNFMINILVKYYFIFPHRKSNDDRVYCKPLDSVPISDQHVALGILLELAIQRGTLQHMLEMILLLLELWDNGQDNDIKNDSNFTDAPLTGVLRRLNDIPSTPPRNLESNKLSEEVLNLVL